MSATSPEGPGDARPAEPPWTSHPVLSGVILSTVPPAATFLVAAFGTFGSPAPYIVGAVAQLLVIVFLVTRTRAVLRRPDPRPSPGPDRTASPVAHIAPPVLTLVGSVATFVLIRMVAGGMGIAGSALPRLRYGLFLPMDVPYLLSSALAVVAAIAAVGAIVLFLVRPHLVAGPGRARTSTAGGTAAAPTTAEAPTRLRLPVPPIATRREDGIVRRMVSPSTWVLIGVGAAAVLVAVLLIALAPIPDGVAGAIAWVVPLASVPATLWSVVQSLWRRDEVLGLFLGIIRGAVISPLAAVGTLLPALVVGLLPQVAAGFRARPMEAISWAGFTTEYLFAVHALPVWIACALMLGVLTSMTLALAVNVLIVVPFAAFLMPQAFLEDNAMSTKDQHREANISAARAMAVLIVLVFVFATLMALSETGDPLWWGAMGTLVVMAVLTAYIMRRQVVDRRQAAARGVSVSPFARTDDGEDDPSDADAGAAPSPRDYSDRS